MNKKLLITGVFIIIAVMVFAFIPKSNSNIIAAANNLNGDKGIQFVEPNWAKAIEQAKKEKKSI